jgi:hypothetical protein
MTAPYDATRGLAGLRRLLEVTDPPEPWAEYFYALDQHLTSGGDLPDAWRTELRARQLAAQLRITATVLRQHARALGPTRTGNFLDARAADIDAVAEQLCSLDAQEV